MALGAQAFFLSQLKPLFDLLQLLRSMALGAQAFTLMFLQVAVALCTWRPSQMLNAAAARIYRRLAAVWTERRHVCDSYPLFAPRSPRGHEHNGFLEEFRPRSADQSALLVVQIAALVAFVLTALGMGYEEQGSGCGQGFVSPRGCIFACVFFGGAFLNCKTLHSIPMI
eukprot:gnl/TRDRNA2_/TRDRNA2_176159_c0_seq1.p1 gnl/TRDRNA2_/TRDRNA2_176159_c0~~gnl/TRDRNA2_/TRDRNA2_176159_c0_seq1.p1  ORF type:complete len:169 (-),score=17.61 gnl/TRDRNA2_/TRDRNA2_176159_c0_seq1:191-697(-)